MNANEVNIFSSTSGLNITLEIICNKAKLMLKSEWVTCLAPSYRTGRMRALVNWGLTKDEFSEFQNLCSEFTLKDIIKEEDGIKSLLIDPQSELPSDLFKYIQESTPARRMLVCPALLYGQLSGYLVWGYSGSQMIPHDAMERAEPFADQVALALKYNQLDRMTRRQNARLAALLDLSTTIYSSLNYQEVLEKVAAYAKDLVGAHSCSIYIYKSFSGDLEPIVVKDKEYSEQLRKYILKPGEGVTGRAVEESSGKIENAYTSADREHGGETEFSITGIPVKAASVMSVPLVWSEEVLGAITLRKWESGTFSRGDLDILTIFARHAADAIENAKLFESLEKAYNELSAAQEQLIISEKLRALGEMAGGIAHDFNNVLGIILGRAQLMMNIAQSEQVKKGLKAIENAAVDGARTIKRIQEFTRVSSQVAESEVDINQVIKEAVEMTRPKWKDEVQRKGIFIDVRMDLKAERAIMGNAADLREVLSNILLNSIDALPDGGRIDMESIDEDDFLEVSIRDNGVGMDEETARKIFFPFFTTKNKQGTGLGLAVAYGIITRHRGEVTVESEPGVGSTFIIKFPHSLQRPGAEDSFDGEKLENRKARILVIDDDKNILSILSEMLSYSGHSVVTAANGQEGLEKFDPKDFDMVFTDLGMPEITGWDIAQEVKAKDRKMPVILVSGWGAQLEDEVLDNSGIDFVIAKPFHLDKILETIKRAFLIREGNPARSIPLRV